MKYVSTRGHSNAVLFSDALKAGLAPDGGLYVPESYPTFTSDEIQNYFMPRCNQLPELATTLLKPWFEQDRLSKLLPSICETAFNFPAPLNYISSGHAILELFHGPTAAFKDFGAQFLAACLEEFPEVNPSTILVATSGDTGGAVASAFFKKTGIRVIILYPKGQVSPLQERQLTTWGENIQAIAVRGTFDDCQKLVKDAISLNTSKPFCNLISANSINLGRLLPQTCYYAASSLSYKLKMGVSPGYIIPTGNLGNAVAALWAKKMGFPIREICLATNSNLTLKHYIETATWSPQPSRKTLANAMDVGNPNNIERLNQLYPNIQLLKKEVRVVSANDEEIGRTVSQLFKNEKLLVCPHTATAFHALRQLSEKWIIASTAHPAKFAQVLEPLTDQTLELPANLARLMAKKPDFIELSADLQSILKIII
jgi:threonine synthase